MPNDQDNADATDSPGVGGLEPGAVVNDSYKVVSLIGKGGMGAVYRVNQMMLGKDLAMKVLDLRRSSEVAARRFQQEARTAAQLRHPNLVEVHDFGVYGTDHPYLVMDLVEGVSLSEVLKAKGALPVNFVIELIIQICFGLIYAHEKGVVHRDIKPGNIMLLHPDQPPAEGTVRIVDFGIAKLTQSEDGEIQALTKTGEIFGSPVYMSPEQCKGTAVDKRSDIFSLGCVMFESLTGSPPFFGDSAMSTMMKRLTEEPVSLKEGSLGGEFPQELETIVRKMLAVEPDDRYQELGVVVKDLMAVQRPDDGVAVSKTIKEMEKKDTAREFALLLVAVFLISVVCTAAVDGYVLLPRDLENERQVRKKKREQAEQVERDRRALEEKRKADAQSAGVGQGYPWVDAKTDAKGAHLQIKNLEADALIFDRLTDPLKKHGK